ncbi:MAG: Nif3-like dinuclear metal center hexameric protein, partial [Ignavibacteriales bacterium]|nr:Nif3-like dinuclear metal center hexameric protein [Ignavibacteriales bacterium]
EEVVAEAQRKKANLIISHHALIFTPLKTLTTENRIRKLFIAMTKANIALLSAHTNLDFTHDGVSFALAERLGLKKVQVLIPQEHALKKIVVFVPVDYVDTVMQAMSKAGAGAIGNYDSCSFQLQGSGTFRGLKGSNPFIGQRPLRHSAGTMERVEEIRLEMIVYTWKLKSVLEALKESHPYEEVAYDVYNLENEANQYGAGAIGELETPMKLEQFLQQVKERLQVPALRFTNNLKSKIKRVAVCGGSGSQIVSSAIDAGADAFVTADIKYHTFQDAEKRIALIDAGHFETEVPIVKKLTSYLKEQLQLNKEHIPVIASTTMTNPVHYYYS